TRLDGSEILDMNERFLEIFGRTREEMQGLPSVIHWADPREREEMVRRLETGERVTNFECGMLNKQGDVLRCLTSLRLYREQGILEGSIIDITERKKAEEELESSHGDLVEAQRAARIGSWTLKFPTSEVTWSKEMYRIFGLDPVYGPPSWPDGHQHLYHPDDWLHSKELIQNAFAAGESYNLENRVIRADDGSIRWTIAIGNPQRSADGSLTGYTGTIQDITERVRAEQALQESEERFNLFMEYFPGQAFINNSEGTTVFGNKRICEFYGCTPEEYSGRKIEELVDPEQAAQLLAQDRKILSEGKLIEIEEIIPYSDGPRHWLTYKFPIHHKDRMTLIGGLTVDITERKRAEDALIASQKLAGLGTLAAGIAHEVNSPLQIITGTSEMAAQRLRDGQVDEQRLLRNMDNINQNAWRVARIVRSLLTYARATYEVIEPNDLNEIIQDTLLMIEHQLRTWSNIYVTSQLAEDLPTLHCERNNISQVLINLLTNARDAMPQGGNVTICTRYDAERERLVLKVTDTGPGIPDEVRAKIFDPFFTTKPVGEGTGLGLSIVMGIVQAHGGEIEVDSAMRQGTTFTISLPEKPPEMPVPSENRDGLGRFDE
ncbi:MAG: PAS domain S-box protein, partial [Anaerolineaceae bacterium]|nr:PAS domain S-box protein [Anaerolineaceae bacterium]